MKTITKLSLISLFSLTVSSQLAFADTSSTFNSEQTKQIESIVHDYIVKNPEVLIEAGKNLQQQAMNKEMTQLKTNVQKLSKDVFNPALPGRFAVGNPHGKIIMTEFFSYQCPNCHKMAKLVDSLVKNNPDLQVIFIAWPFENNDDVYAAKAVFAAQKQGKINELHTALLNTQAILTKDSIDKIVKTIPGLDTAKLQQDMNDGSLDDALKANFKLAETLGLNFTPIFLVTNQEQNKFTIVPGRVEAAELNKAIKEVR